MTRTRSAWVSTLVAVPLLALAWPPAAAFAQSEFHVDTQASIGLVVYGLDVAGNVVPNTDLSLSPLPNAGEGGHFPGHSAQRTPGFLGTVSPSTCNTGSGGDSCVVTFTAKEFGGQVNIQVTVRSGPSSGHQYQTQPILIGALGGFDMPIAMENYASADFALVGQTATHPDNHYCQTDICENAVRLAQDYLNQWGNILAYNDAALRKGGLFDLNANWLTPHSEHRLGRNIDVRANGGSFSIPFDSTIRDWFVQRVIEIFGQAPLHESEGTGNEHYHIRG
jgi:hypothetical protein